MEPTDYSYLLSRQSDPERLRRIAFEEFTRTRNSGRMVGFVGSYASQHLGYPDWHKMVREFIDNNEIRAHAESVARGSAGGTLDPEIAALFARLQAHAGDETPKFPVLDLMDLAELLGKVDKQATPKAYCSAREDFADQFALSRVANFAARPNVALALAKRLNLTRFMTLNYDLELEWAVFQTDYERLAGDKNRRATWKAYDLEPSGPSLRLERAIAGRGRVTSDVVSREDNAQLIEFALDSPVLHSRIMHMHGRQDDPMHLLVTRRDYRDRYWQNGFSKLPFEYGMRLIFAGNPILFVGIGGTEQDVMRELEQLLSDNPNRRAVPMFMLWNSSGDLAEDNIRRLTFYRRYGIHMLFDDEVALRAGKLPTYRVEKKAERPRYRNALRLSRSLEMLADIAEGDRGGRKWAPTELRTPQAKYAMSDDVRTGTGPGAGTTYRIDIWRHLRSDEADIKDKQVRVGEKLQAKAPDRAIVSAIQASAPITVFTGGPGSGRGALANVLADAFEQYYAALPHGRVVVVNGAFATETDSIFGILSGALDERTAQASEISRARSIRQMYEYLSVVLEQVNKTAAPGPGGAKAPGAPSPSVTVIINGIERFLAHDGSALSNELDVLIRLIIRQYRAATPKVSGLAKRATPAGPPPVSLVLIGTQRVVRYLSVVAPDLFDRFEIARDESHTKVAIGKARDTEISIRCSCYFSVVAKLVNRAAVRASAGSAPARVTVRVPAITRGSSSNRRSFYKQIFDGAFPAGQGITNPGLAFEVLRVLAYIGQPTELEVLWHAPSLRHSGDPRNRTDLETTVTELSEIGLVLKILQFPGGSPRMGLHKTVIAEIRERYGVPMSDSRLANGFNLSLYTAQPVDTYMPEQRWHQELAKLVDFLMGSYRDPETPSSALAAAATAVRGAIASDATLTNLLGSFSDAQLARLASGRVSECLRAALSLLRSYYSVPALLMHSNRDFDPWMRDGPLSEHADRITRLIRVCEQSCAMRTLVTAQDATLEAELGPAPLYPDDLVWLNNELGVVRTTQGSLYDARRAFNAAGRANNRFVEYGEQQHNWRRIQMNQVQVDIDRGRIEPAEDRIRDIEIAIEEQAAQFKPQTLPEDKTCLAHMLEVSGGGVADGANRSAPDGRPARVDPNYPTDLILAAALTQGYRGLCQHLRGALEASAASFDAALRVLVNLNEQRAYAFFQRHSASVRVTTGDYAAAQSALTLSVAAAGPTRQTDIDHASRVSLGLYQLVHGVHKESQELRKFIPQLTETLRYATTSDMYRLQVEAMQTLAAVHLRNGDGDSALRFATDALAVATRCGFGLRKVSLRVLVGRILAFRKDPAAARELLTSASMVATKIHYERAVEAAENERVALGQ